MPDRHPAFFCAQAAWLWLQSVISYCNFHALTMHLSTPHFFWRPWAWATLCCVLVLPGVHAEQADRDKPTNIEADALRFEDATQTSVFTGNVVLTKGTIVIRGNRLTMRQDADGNQLGIAEGTAATRAFFRQKREGLNEFIEGEALRIEYDSQADLVRFTGNAVVRRLRGSTLSDESQGNVIVFNNRSETFTVDSRPGRQPGVASTPENGGRVRAMLAPREQAAPKPDAAIPLQPSTELESPR
jgi:lipopolysaccharide export system protein LptA